MGFLDTYLSLMGIVRESRKLLAAKLEYNCHEKDLHLCAQQHGRGDHRDSSTASPGSEKLGSNVISTVHVHHHTVVYPVG